MAFLLLMNTWSMVLNLIQYYTENQVVLLTVGGAIFVLEVWLIFEAVSAVRRVWRTPDTAAP
jgi:carbon starvation protein